mmetsp:Transcript_10108/g.22687  ORF Transcript_10108/g.22687 Transcript_10108/m.22687 type:complete len:316 (-) Transcript_10108:123-1070(-)|eukprot:CAMPEP_0170612538 /NCGR_PEP_ID=MMETSP0224-20130122/23778_1 /TAXON_ID=285029 /ORGANISM="Togula jolla, Strain CCCM 725" /LENGTH=315 /DNA_ID=CAMNT_0010938051 /DNA_START=57 /DNA_END=1004 /DNA_ORIENTATION=+
MACLFNNVVKTTNKPVSAGNDYERPPSGEIHMLICALDYKRTENPLTCTIDGKNMQELADLCGVRDLTVMLDEECSAGAVTAKIQEIGQRCGEDDYFIFYYSGHGLNIADEGGDEEDGEDEAFAFVDAQGQVSYDTVLTDDDFATVITSSIPPNTRILILTDCCHSGTICDFDREEWADHEAISIAGCMDSQTSGDIGTGGIFTHSMLMAIEELMDMEEYSVGKLYNTTLKFDDKVFNSAQDITVQSSSATRPHRMAWPLVPLQDYQSPMRKSKNPSRGLNMNLPGVSTAMASLAGDLPNKGDVAAEGDGRCSIM